MAAGVIALVAGLRFAFLWGAPPEVHLQPYQRLDSSLTPAQRTLYQALLASVDEIVGTWRSTGHWPSIQQTADDGLPPFARALVPPALRTCVWTGHDETSWGDYLGRCTLDGQAQTFLLRIVDLVSAVHPHPHPTYDPGLTVAAQVWMFLGPDAPYPMNSLLEADWIWVVNLADPSLKDRR